MSRSTASTDDLLRRARQGDREALGELLGLHRPYLKVLAQRMLDSRLAARLDASDVVQQTLLSAYRQFAEFRGATVAEFLAWLRVMHRRNVKNTLRAHLAADKRAVQREAPLDDGDGTAGGPRLKTRARRDETPSQRAIAGEDAVRLARALEALSDDQREAVRLRHLEGWSLDELARHFGRSEVAVAGLLKRGLAKLREGLKAED
jgi:RNA polymerase sigma-70 factor (ECF subfamily)